MQIKYGFIPFSNFAITIRTAQKIFLVFWWRRIHAVHRAQFDTNEIFQTLDSENVTPENLVQSSNSVDSRFVIRILPDYHSASGRQFCWRLTSRTRVSNYILMSAPSRGTSLARRQTARVSTWRLFWTVQFCEERMDRRVAAAVARLSDRRDRHGNPGCERAGRCRCTQGLAAFLTNSVRSVTEIRLRSRAVAP